MGDVMLVLSRRPDGGLRIHSQNVPGLILSGDDPRAVLAKVWGALLALDSEPQIDPLERFKPGTLVTHINCGPGVVSEIEGGFVCVTYERKGQTGRPWTGRYDRQWFDIHPGALTETPAT